MYFAIVGKLENIRPHPDADKIQLASCYGSQVVVGLDSKDGDIVLFFDTDGQLSEEYCFNNNLYSRPENNRDQTKKGYFDHKRRVKAQTFRGAKSEAYVASLETLEFCLKVDGIDPFKLEIGTKLNELNGFHICNKYMTPETIKQSRLNQPKQPKLNQILKSIFKEHIDTEQIKYARDEELIGLVTITHKLHGTSARSGLLRVPVEQELNIFKRAWNKFVSTCYYFPHIPDEERFWEKSLFYPESKYEWQSIFGTRRVCKGKVTEKHTDYRAKCHKILEPNILKGETWYYEIVGYEDTGAAIMQTVCTDKMPKEFIKQFGKFITYKYGCLPGCCDIYVYRITTQNEDGNIYELPWSQVKQKCKFAGVKHVPEITALITHTWVEPGAADLKKLVEQLTEDDDLADPIDPSHIREGIVARIDNLDTGKAKFFKNKTFAFKVLEGIVKDAEEYVDEEESQTEASES